MELMDEMKSELLEFMEYERELVQKEKAKKQSQLLKKVFAKKLKEDVVDEREDQKKEKQLTSEVMALMQ